MADHRCHSLLSDLDLHNRFELSRVGLVDGVHSRKGLKLPQSELQVE